MFDVYFHRTVLLLSSYTIEGVFIEMTSTLNQVQRWLLHWDNPG